MIDTAKYQNFLQGRFFYEGLRVTAGILLPALITGYFGKVNEGLIMSLGALCVSIADSPGPIHHRKNAMLVSVILISLLSMLTPLMAINPVVLGLFIFATGFIFSMAMVFGQRVSSIGISAMVIVILGLQNVHTGSLLFRQAYFISIGGAWYMAFSLLLYQLRPYKIIQQVLGDFIIEVGDYFRQRALFYTDKPNYDEIYASLFKRQVDAHNHQELLSDLIFKTRIMVKESSNTSRRLMKIYIDVADLLESIMTSYHDYRELHIKFDYAGILPEIGDFINKLCDELHDVGLNVKAGTKSNPADDLEEQMLAIEDEFAKLRINTINEKNVEQFVGLGRIVSNLRGITNQIKQLHYYTDLSTRFKKMPDVSGYISDTPGTEIRPSIFVDNLSFKSLVFRHSLRVALALLSGYLLSNLFGIGHNYWVLLTIFVILKPSYSLSRKRNRDRLIGTLLGIIVGIFILQFIKAPLALLLTLGLLMVITYSFLRTNYFIAVLAMTPYLVIFFHLLYPSNLTDMLADRVLDTTIGSVIALVASFVFVPNWEHQNIRGYMNAFLEKASDYYSFAAEGFSGGRAEEQEEAIASRKELMVALANVSDAFNRMISEPKIFRKGETYVHRFVVLAHILSSHLASLSYYFYVNKSSYSSASLIAFKENTKAVFANAQKVLDNEEQEPLPFSKQALEAANREVADILMVRKNEIAEGRLETPTKKKLIETKSVVDQFKYIENLANEICKVCNEMSKA